jgi:hypothetical protein
MVHGPFVRHINMNRILHLKVSIRDSKPAIWRRVLVADHWSFSDLHEILQICFCWSGQHQYEFDCKGRALGNSDYAKESSEIPLSDLLDAEKTRCVYIYDFGDYWEHTVLVEKITNPEPDTVYPYCLAGKRAGPPENSGGIFEYEDKIALWKEKKTPKNPMLFPGFGAGFNPESCVIEVINQRLQEWKQVRDSRS